MSKKMKLMLLVLIAFSSLVLAENWKLEFRPGVNIPTAEFDGSELNNGLGLEARVAYRVMPHVDIFTGWSWANFTADNDLDFEETGYNFGASFIHPLPNMKLSYLVEAAATLKHVEVEFDNDIVADGNHSFGYQLGAGIVYPINQKLSLTPSIRYSTLTNEVEFDDTGIKSEGDLNYISLGISFSWSL
jgi:opacity protein-like surface antigen